GRPRRAHTTGPGRFLAARRRAGGFCATAAAAGVRFSPSDVLYGEWSERWGREGARILLASNPGVQAIFCGSDQIGRGVSDTLRQLGYRVPDDIALVGFDNWDPMVAGAEPPLSSIDMCLVDVGRTAAEHLLSAIAGPAPFASAARACAAAPPRPAPRCPWSRLACGCRRPQPAQPVSPAVAIDVTSLSSKRSDVTSIGSGPARPSPQPHPVRPG